VDTVEVVAKPVEKVPLNLEQPQPLKPKQIDWFVITPENQEEVFAKLKEKKFSVVLYGLTDDDYKDLSENLAKLRSFILQQKAIIESYKEYYEPPVPQETLK
jgi:hypothetical protein